MPIKSYLVHPHIGQKNELTEILSKMDQCEVLPAENKNIVVLVTETDTDQEDEQLKEKLEMIPSLKLLALVSGFNTPSPNKN